MDNSTELCSYPLQTSLDNCTVNHGSSMQVRYLSIKWKVTEGSECSKSIRRYSDIYAKIKNMFVQGFYVSALLNYNI